MTKICNWILEPRLCKSELFFTNTGKFYLDIVLHHASIITHMSVPFWPGEEHHAHVSHAGGHGTVHCHQSEVEGSGLLAAGSHTERPQLGWAPLLSPCTDTLTLIVWYYYPPFSLNTNMVCQEYMFVLVYSLSRCELWLLPSDVTVPSSFSCRQFWHRYYDEYTTQTALPHISEWWGFCNQTFQFEMWRICTFTKSCFHSIDV